LPPLLPHLPLLVHHACSLPTSFIVVSSIPTARTIVQDAALHVSPSRRSEFVDDGPGAVGGGRGATSYAGSVVGVSDDG